MGRPSFSLGGYVTAADLHKDQKYRQRRQQCHNRFLHNWGIVCGLRVVPAQDPARPWAVLVCPGYAIDCCGREIEVPEAAKLDIREHLWKRPSSSSKQFHPSLAAATRPTAYVAVRYAEELVHPIPAPQPACGCEDTLYEASRIRDSYRLDVLWTRPRAQEPSTGLCAETTSPCPDCTDRLHVFLARITLPASQGDPITPSHIHLREY